MGNDVNQHRERRYSERRWALIYKFDGYVSLLGKYCWWGATQDEQVIKTFRTRKQAREARRECCYPSAKIIKVELNITRTGGE